MTSIQVFEYFCRVNRIKPVLIENFKKNGPIDWGKVNPHMLVRNQKELPKVEYYDSMKSCIDSGGFNDLIHRMSYNHYYEMRKKSEAFRIAATKWFRFSNNNIRLSEESLKVGDEVEWNARYFFPAGDIKKQKGVVTSISAKDCYANVEFEDKTSNETKKRTVGITFTQIKKVNGKKFTPDFVIKRRKKIVAR